MLEALTYCLMLKPPLLTVTTKVMQMLNEVLAITEADNLDHGQQDVPALHKSLPGCVLISFLRAQCHVVERRRVGSRSC